MSQVRLPSTDERWLKISISSQTLELVIGDRSIRKWLVSTAKNGLGEQRGSECTPRGWHRIRARIGEGMPLHTAFRGRRPAGEFDDGDDSRQRDWILTRILWLGGLEPGFNRYGSVDTTWRFIYIHGSPDWGVTGEPASHGCVRLRCDDMLEVFDLAPAGMKVLIEA